MYVKNSNFAIYLGLAALVGFSVSFLFNAGDVQNNLLSGDISKSSRYNNQRVDPESTIIEEKLSSDSEFFQSTKAAVDFLRNRTAVLTELTDETLKLAGDIPELQESLRGIASLSAKAYNTGLAFEQVSNGLDKIASGKKAPEYEQASNDAFAGFRKVEGQLGVSKTFVEAANDYLSENDNSPLAAIVAVWSAYCAQDAVLNDSKEDIEYWADRFAQTSSASLGNVSYGNDVLNTFTIGLRDNMAKEMMTTNTVPLKADDVRQAISTTLKNAGDVMDPSQFIKANDGNTVLQDITANAFHDTFHAQKAPFMAGQTSVNGGQFTERAQVVVAQ